MRLIIILKGIAIIGCIGSKHESPLHPTDGSHICARAAAPTSLSNCTPLSLPHCTPISMSSMENLTTFGISPTFKTLIELNQVSWYLQGKTSKTQKISIGLSFEKDP